MFRQLVRGAASSGFALIEREAEIDQDRTPVLGQNDVGRLDVAMDHPLGMSVRERIGDVGDDSRRFPEVRSAVLELRKQVLAAEQRGDDVAVFAFHAGIEYGDDSRMLQSGELTGLLDEGFVAVRGAFIRAACEGP